MYPGPYPGGAGAGFGATAESQKDVSDLNTLSILHYVWSGILGLTTLGMIGYFLLLGGVFGASAASGGADAGGMAVAAGIMVVLLVVFGLVLAGLCVLHLLAASGLRKRTRRTVTYIASALMCMSFPLGTALGVWTFVVLSRPSVKALYGVH